MAIDYRALKALDDQLNAIPLTGKTAAEKELESRLKIRIACVRSGMPYRDIQQEMLNDIERTQNLPVTSFERDTERRAEARAWAHFIRSGEILQEVEQRDAAVGNGKPNYLLGNLGSFVPRSWMVGLTAAVAQIDPMCNGSVIQYIETEKNSPMQFGFYDDTNAAASVAAENSDQSGNQVALGSPSAVDIFGYSYRLPLYRVSWEAMGDLQQMETVIGLFQKYSAIRLARGISKDLLTGSGVSKPLGLLTSLSILGSEALGIVAQGSSANSGGSENGSNSIGSQDIANLYGSVNDASRNSSRAAWLMNDLTRTYLAGIVTKFGVPLMHWQGTQAFIYGKPVYTSPSMPTISAMAQSVIFGDLGMWVSRRTPGQVRVFKEFVGGIERGEFGLSVVNERWDGALLFNSANAASCPLKYLQNHT